MELAVRESDAVESARRTLGLKLAICRRAGGYSQADFASLIDYSRSTVANVETGRQRVPSTFWAAADAAARSRVIPVRCRRCSAGRCGVVDGV